MSEDVFASFYKMIVQERMLVNGEKVLAAVSGGPDSMALLHLLLTLLPSEQIGVFHLNHQLRSEGAQEAAFVAAYARENGAAAHIYSCRAVDYVQRRGDSLQQGARRLRYELLESCAAMGRYHRIALGHHQDDQAETVFMRLLRGAGTLGLAGIPPRRQNIIRPLLNISKDALLDYCRLHCIPFVVDPSNASRTYLRNRIRLELMPRLEQYNPAIRVNLSRLADRCREDERYLQEAAHNAFSQLASIGAKQVTLDRPALVRLPVSLQRRVIRLALEAYRGHLRRLDYKHVESLRSAALGRHPFALDLPLASITGTAKTIAIGACFLPEIDWVPQELACGTVDLGPYLITMTLAAVEHAAYSSSPWEEDFDWDRLSPPLYVRKRRPGDRMQVFGQHNRKKLKDIFINAQVPLRERERYPIICDQEEILFVPGVRRSERGRVTEATRHVLRISVQLKKGV